MKNDNDILGHLEREDPKMPEMPGIEVRTEGCIGAKDQWKIEALLWILGVGVFGVIIFQMFRGLLW